MEVCTILARKGGTGKSSAARHIAVEAAKAGRKVVIVDADPQGTCLRWGTRRKDAGIPVPLVVAAAPGGLKDQLDRYKRQGVVLVLIDTPPSATPAVNAALEVATSALVVTRPNLEDLEAIAETMRIAGSMGRRTGVVIWQAPADKRIRVVGLARDYLKANGIEACPTAITASVGYPYAYSENLTVQERDPDGRARAELAELWGWLQRDGIIRP